MRKTLEAIALAALALSFWITWQALTGPTHLPDKIPTHYDAAGNPNGWDSSSSLLALPLVALVVYLIMTAVSRFPAAFSYPVRVTEDNRARLQSLTLQMVACLKAELLCLFGWIQWIIVESARNGRTSLSPLAMPIVLVAIFGTVGWHIFAIFRTARNS
jgi:uncharacterized membrane protein